MHNHTLDGLLKRTYRLLSYGTEKNIDILDTYGQLMTRVPELDKNESISWNVTSCSISGDQMVSNRRTRKIDNEDIRSRNAHYGEV